MSVVGTGIANGVAQATLQAQQVARRRDAQENEAARELRKVRDLFESHLARLEEADQDESPTHLHVEGELPEHQSAQQETPQHPHKKNADQTVTAAQTPPTDEGSPPPASEETLYRHLDVQA